MKKNPCLAIGNPQVASEWHPTLNGTLTPYDVSSGSAIHVYWQCSKNAEHVWNSAIRERKKGTCPYCSGRKIDASNSLAALSPKIASEWHPTLNGTLTPHDVSVGSGTVAYWQCLENPEHVWKVSVNNRQRWNCPYCSGRKTDASNCLANVNPELAAQWHPLLNGTLTPHDVTLKSGRSVFWFCPVAEDHVWETNVAARANGTECPYCSGNKVCISNCIATTMPDIAAKWAYELNEITPYDVTPGSGTKVWWKCPVAEDHVWSATISEVSGGGGCSCCRGFKVVPSNCLATKFPEIAEQWHPTLNGLLTANDVSFGTGTKIWWECPVAEDHVWEEKVSERTSDKRVGCPYCSNHRVCASNCLANIRPEIAKEWHPTLNGDLTPYDVTLGSSKKAHWQCLDEKKHTWFCEIFKRKSSYCPYCRISRGERKIHEVLSELEVNHEREAKFKDCKKVRRLRFDFIVRSKPVDVIYSRIGLIEFQGGQHYTPVAFGNYSKEDCVKRFEKIVEYDEYKKRWCQEKKIPLLVIPYWDYENIKNIIEAWYIGL